MKKRETAAKRTNAEADDGEKLEKSKTEENDARTEDGNESEKKKPIKKATIIDSSNESEDKKDDDNEVTEEKIEDATEGDEMQVDKLSDAEDDEKKGDDKEKRKKFVRLWCVHCRIESATFKVNAYQQLKKKPRTLHFQTYSIDLIRVMFYFLGLQQSHSQS